MDYLTAFDISASGMSVEKLRMDLISLNLANANTTRTSDGAVYKPLALVTKAKTLTFDAQLQHALMQHAPKIAEISEIAQVDAPEKLSFEPKHPDADKNGFVHYPGVNTTSEMINMIKATRAYEANVRAFNAAKAMAQKALEIGN